MPGLNGDQSCPMRQNSFAPVAIRRAFTAKSLQIQDLQFAARQSRRGHCEQVVGPIQGQVVVGICGEGRSTEQDVEKKQPLHFLAMLVEELLTVRVRLT